MKLSGNTVDEMTEETMNICILSSDAFVSHAAALIASVMENNDASDNIVFHYFCENVSDKSKTALLSMQQKWVFGLSFYNLTVDFFDGYPQYTNTKGTYMGYYKIVIPRLLPQEVDKILFLDADMIVQTSLAPLYETGIEGKYAAVVAERKSRSVVSHDKPYFNAGMILMNVKKYREDHVEEQIKELAQERIKDFPYLEQDLFNEIFQGNVVYVHPIWNGFLWKGDVKNYNFHVVEKQLSLCYPIEWIEQSAANPNIVHYVNHIKPWHCECNHVHKHIYWKYAKLTPFYNLVKRDVEIQLQQSEIERSHDNLALLQQKRSIYWHYYRCKVLAKITFGITRKHYKEKRNILHEKVRRIRNLR